jgi:hypothetical protein
MTAKRKWLPIVGGIAVLVVFAGLGAAWFGISWFREHLEVTAASSDEATRAFDEVKAKFPGRAPLLEFSGGTPRVNMDTADAGRAPESLTTLHVIAWDPDDRQLARFDIPFWFVRLKSGPIEFSSYASGLDKVGVSLKVEDIERYGKGIIVDASMPRGERALIWAE